MSFLEKIFGDPNERVINSFVPLLDDINNLEERYEKFTTDDIKEENTRLRQRAGSGEDLDKLLPEAFALCREAAKRTLGQRHYDVQIFGGIALHRGHIAEMRTGEGKTLTSTLPVYLNALAGKGVHLVTVNDYLARRDAVWMGQVYAMLGLTVSCINNNQTSYVYDASWTPEKGTEEITGQDLSDASAKEEGGETDKVRDARGAFEVQMDYMKPCTRQEAYLADVTYGTNNEFGFDFLRDNMAVRPESRSQRSIHYAIIDEVDSILIDEARTPLIISAPAEEAAEMYYRFADLVKRLVEDQDYNIDEKMHATSLTDEGIGKLEKMLGVENIYEEAGIKQVHHIEQALRAHALFKRDRDYVVKEGEVIIVDEFTGRLMPGRRYSEGLHQAIEAKEGVEIQRESQTLATITFQNLFRMYDKLAGMTGTAATEAEEFSKIYDLDVTVIPTNKDPRRDDLQDRVYQSEKGKFHATVREIKERHEKGQPVLVGTVSIEKNEILGEMLRREGIPHELLNAKNHEREAQIIAQAGREGAVTVATNMAGRGVDIVLGGNPLDQEAADRIKALGGLMVIGTERHESRRIDNQLRGRAGRQGDAGTTQFFVSMEDDLMRIFGSDRIKGVMEKMGVPEDMPIENKMVSRSIESAQKKVEGHHFDTRKHLLEYDDVLNKHREVVYRKRQEILFLEMKESAPMKDLFMEMLSEEIDRVVLFHTASDEEKEWDLQEIYEVAATIFPIGEDARKDIKDFRQEAGDKEHDAQARTHVISYLLDIANTQYDRLEGAVNIDLGDRGTFPMIAQSVMLRAIDTLWVEHLDSMEHLRTGIGLRSYGQRDPLIEYKNEAYRMFNELIAVIQKQIVYTMFKVGIARQQQARVEGLMGRRGLKLAGASKSGGDAPQASGGAGKSVHKVGRNDPCPCGSGKKYKRCHGV